MEPFIRIPEHPEPKNKIVLTNLAGPRVPTRFTLPSTLILISLTTSRVSISDEKTNMFSKKMAQASEGVKGWKNDIEVR